MNARLKAGIAVVLVALSAGLPLALLHRARLETDARREVLGRQVDRLSLLVRENGRLSNLVAQAAPPLTEEQLRELLRLRDERRRLAEQTNRMAGLRVGNNPASPAEIHRALSAEMVEAMKRILPGLEPALRQYALAHPDRVPDNLADLADYFPMIGGRRMPGLQTFEFARDDGPRPGDALLLRADVPSDDVKVRIYGFSDGRVVEVTAEDGRFDDWERQHMSSLPAGTEEKIYLEAEGTARDRAHLTELAASVGISAEEAGRFFDQLKQRKAVLDQRMAEMAKNLTGSVEEKQSQMRAVMQEGLTKLADETLGDKGPALARKMVEP